MSTLHHSLTSPKAKHLFLILDYSAIYLVIAATYTPFLIHVTNLKTSFYLFLFILIWLLSVTGITLSAIFSKKVKTIAPIFYILLGWLSIFILPEIMNKSGPTTIIFLVSGGIMYTIGTYWYLEDIRPYHHAIWHAHVLLASICHFLAIASIL